MDLLYKYVFDLLGRL